MSEYKPYKWHNPQWSSLLAKPEGLHHAILLAGPPAIGKSAFGEALAARLLCEQIKSPADFACGHCDGCHWFDTGSHPDYRKVSLEVEEEAGEDLEGTSSAGSKRTGKAKATQIRIDQIRALEEFVFVGSHRQGNRVVVIDPADLMNPSAANSLLKLLEEPPLNIYFLLISSKWRNLIPTLRSRCRQLLFAIPERRLAIEWLDSQGIADAPTKLSLAGGGPLKVTSLSKDSKSFAEPVLASLGQQKVDPLGLSASWESELKGNSSLTLEGLVDVLQKWIYDLIRVKLGASPKYMMDKSSAVSAISAKADLSRLTKCYGDLLKIRMVAGHPLNVQLFLEDLAVRYTAAVTAGRQ